MAHSEDVTKRILLRRDVDRLMEQVRDLEGLREGIGHVAAAVDELADRQKEAKPPPIHWPDLAEDTYAQAWPAFLGWLRDVLVDRYPAEAGVLTPCWWQHLDAVDALTAGWQTWLAAYRNPAAEAAARADWQFRIRPAMRDTVETALRGCGPDGRHEERLERPDVVAGYSTGASV